MADSTRRGAVLAGALVLTLVTARPAGAQWFEAVGARAQGLGGAFVAVADDATAVYWNPAGLALGPFFSLVVETGLAESGPAWGEGAAGTLRQSGTLIALASLPVGVAYYRLPAYSAEAVQPGQAVAPVAALVTDHVGATLVHSLTSSIAVGGTLKYVRGSAGHGVAETATDPFDAAESLPRRSSSAFDVDVGILAAFGRVRVGLVGRNLVAPEFEAPDGAELGLERQVRAGVALVPSDRLLLALDADFTRTPTAAGERRNVAAGVETWFAKRRVGVRSGFRVSTVGDARPVGAFGGSFGLFRAFWVDGQYTAGVDEGDRGWTVGGSVRY
jgi:hypothetical protein